MSTRRFASPSSASGSAPSSFPSTSAIPNAEMYAICRRDQKELDAVGDRFGIETRYTSYEDAAEGPQRRRRPHQLADRRPRAAVDRGAQGRQARRQHGAGGDDDRRVPADRRVAAQERQGLHDDGDRRLQPRVPVREGAVRQGRARPDPVHARQPSAGHGRLAGLLGGLSADALRDALRQPVPGDPRQARRARRLPRLGPHRRAPDPEVRQPVRDRDGDVQAARLRRRAPKSRAACSTPRGSIARASTSTDRRSRSSGSRSRTKSRSSTRRARRRSR